MTDNRLLKLVSLLAAILLAYAVTSDRNSSVLSMSVPLEIKNPPEDQVLVKPIRRMVQVTLRGPSFLVGPIASSPPPFKVTIPERMEDRIRVSLRPSDLVVPSMIEVLSVEPAEMDLVFEPIERREFKVEVPRVGQLEKQYTLSRLDFEPKVVTVRGPRSELKQIKTVETEPLDLETLSESKTVTLGVRNPGSHTALGTKSVSVRVAINEIPDQMSFAKRPVELRTIAATSGVMIEPTEVDVVVEGPPTEVADLKGDQVIPFVRVSEKPGDEGAKMPVQVELPDSCEECSVVKVEPDSVLVLAGKKTTPKVTKQVAEKRRR